MKFAVNVPNYGTFAAPRFLAGLAREAEAAGWDGFFLWDHLQAPDMPLGETWMQLAAIATVTQSLRIGPMVTPLPRRRPWRLARQAVTLDHLSGGRLILGLGLGDDAMREYSAFGEPADARRHAAMLDEGLAVLQGLWSGEAFSFHGEHYRLDDVRFLPSPVQQPRIPIWLAGGWPSRRPFRRAAGWDGVVPVSRRGPLTAAECAEIVEFVAGERVNTAPLDVAVTSWYAAGGPKRDEVEAATQFARAGATWYQVSLPAEIGVEEAREVIGKGPPRIAS